MGSTVKKVAPIALAAAGGYAAMSAWSGPVAAGGGISHLGSAGMASLYGGAAASGATGFMSGISNALGGNLLSKGGLLMQGVSAIQSRKYAKEGAAMQRLQVQASNKAEMARNRFNNMVQQRQRLALMRQNAIRKAEVETGAAGGGIGIQGTSPVMGSIGASSSQISANLGNINVAQDVGNQITGYNTSAANYGSQANTASAKQGMWSQMQVLGGNLLTNSAALENIFSFDTP